MTYKNANYGIVRRISADRTTITIAMPRGGTFECQNEGFRIGQSVCFILNTLKNKIVKVLPKEVADVQTFLGTNPELQEALTVEPDPAPMPTIEDEEEYDDDYLKYLNDILPDNRRHEGSVSEEDLDLICEIARENVDREDYSSWPGYTE